MECAAAAGEFAQKKLQVLVIKMQYIMITSSQQNDKAIWKGMAAITTIDDNRMQS